MRPRIRRQSPKPEPAEALFRTLLRNAARDPASGAWQHLIDHLLANEQDDMSDLVWTCYGALDLLDNRDARFISDMTRIVGRYAVSPKQSKWVLDIYRRLQCYWQRTGGRGIGTSA